MGTRASVISICKGPAFTKARLPGAAARVLSTVGPPPPAQPATPRPAPPPAPEATPSPPAPPGPARPGRRPGHPLPRFRPLHPACGDISRPRPGPRWGRPSLCSCRVHAGPRRRRGGRTRPPCTPRPRGGGPGFGILAYRLPGLRRRAPPRAPWPRARSGLAGGGSGSGSRTAAPSALGSRLCSGRPQRRTPGWKGQARAGRRSQGGAGRSAAPPPARASGLPREERRALPGPRPACPRRAASPRTASQAPTARVAGACGSRVPAWLPRDTGLVVSEI